MVVSTVTTEVSFEQLISNTDLVNLVEMANQIQIWSECVISCGVCFWVKKKRKSIHPSQQGSHESQAHTWRMTGRMGE